MGRVGQHKGHVGELELARILQGYGHDVQPGRVQSYGEVPDLSGLLGVRIECKRDERLNMPEAMARAIRDAERFQDGVSTVFHRCNHSGWLVAQRLEDWTKIHKNSHVKKGKRTTNKTVVQIIPAPSNLMYAYDEGTAQSVAYLALVELADGDRETRTMGLTNGETFEEQPGAILPLESDTNQQKNRPGE